MKAITLSSGLLVSILACLALGEFRTWTDYRGQTVNAEFVEATRDAITLRTDGGETINIPFNRLSRSDQAYARQVSMGGGTSQSAESEIPGPLLELFGDELVNADKKDVSTAVLADKKRIGIYFSAKWCGPCRRFTPKLVETYNELKNDGKPFEIVFVSHDTSKGSMFDYMEEDKMPWLAVPYKEDEREDLKKKFNIRGIPTLVIIDDKGKTISTSARMDVASRGVEAYDKW